MVMKESVEDMFPQWPEKDDDRQLDNLIRDLHSGTFVRGDYWDVQRKEEKKKPKLAQRKEEKKKPKLDLVPYDSESEQQPPKKKQKKEKKNEGEGAAIEKKEDAKGKGLSDDAAVLNTIVAQLDRIENKFARKLAEMEKKIGDSAKDAVDERLKVLGLLESVHNSPKPQTLPPHKSVNSPTAVLNTDSKTPENVVCSVDANAESRTPQEHFPKSKAAIPTKGTPDELDNAGIRKGTPEAKKNLFGSGLPDFVGVSPAKEKQIPGQRRMSRRQNPIPKIENAAEFQKRKDDAAKKKADAATKRRETAAKKKEDKLAAELKGNEENTAAELKNTLAVLKKEFQEKGRIRRVPSRVPATPGKKKGKSVAETDLEDVTEEEIAKRNELLPESDEDEDERLRLARIKDRRTNVVHLLPSGLAAEHAIGGWTSGVFPYLFGDQGPTCMRKDVEPSSAIYDPFAPVDTYNLGNFKQHLNTFEDIFMAINEQKDDDRSSEANFYRVLITERPWRNNDDGWLSDDHVAAYIRVLIRRSMEEPTPFCSERIAFVDQWFLGAWMKEYNQFKINPKLFKFEGTGYEKLINGEIPHGLQTKKKWFQDVDHLYGVLNTSGCHWVAFHVDLLKEKIDVYDPIIGDVHPEKEQSRLDAFRPLLEMIPAMIKALIPGQKTVGEKPFAFTWKTAKNIPQNTQSGDCGVYSLKFVECLALGVTFDGICDSNIQGLRVKMAVDIFDERGYAMLYGEYM